MPTTKQVVLSRPLFAKGKGLPKDGVCVASECETVTVETANGHEWFVVVHYKGKTLRIATILSTL